MVGGGALPVFRLLPIKVSTNLLNGRPGVDRHEDSSIKFVKVSLNLQNEGLRGRPRTKVLTNLVNDEI